MAGTNTQESRRLDSWKEIAVFFGRDERTVNRWEKERGLPVHRLPGAKGRVYAYTDELSDWLANSRNVTDSSADVIAPAMEQPPPETSSVGAPPVLHKSKWPLTALVVVLAIIGIMFLRYPKSGHSSVAAGHRESGEDSRGSVHASSHAHNPEAEQLYLEGRYYWNKRSPDDLNKAVDYFTQAIVHDPNYASAYVGLADCYNLLREYTVMPAAQAYVRSFAAAKKAVELDDQSSAAHASLAFVMFWGRWEVVNAETEFRRAIDLDPNNAVAHHWYANYLLTVGRLTESLSEIERAQVLEPASTSILADKGNILSHVGRRDEAVTLLQHLEASDPSFRSPHRYLAEIYLAAKDYPNFLAESKKDALSARDSIAMDITTAAEKGYSAGAAIAMLENMLKIQKKYYDQKLISPVSVARTSALLGRKDEALQFLKSAYDQHDELLLAVGNYYELKNLHDEPAFRDLLSRMNLPVGN